MCPDDYQSVVFCKFCQKSFMTENEFNQHNVLEHSNIVEFQDQLPVNEKILQLQKIPQAVSLCALCRTSFPRVRDLAKHVLSQHPVDQLESGQVFSCQLCPDVGYLQLKDLESHTSRQHQDETPSYRCPDCIKEFKAARFLRNHIRNHLSQKAFQCSRCRKFFSMEGAMREHLKKCGVKKVTKAAKVKLQQIDSGEKKVLSTSVPPTEGNSPNNIGQLAALQADGEEDRGRRFTCTACGGAFKSKVLCQQHIYECGSVLADLNENGPKPVGHSMETSSEIPGVAKEFNDSQVITEEEPKVIDMSMERDKPRNHHCQLCDKTFLTLSHLKEHMIQHTGVFPFNCSSCGKGFKRKNVQQNHVCTRTLVSEETSMEMDSSPIDGKEKVKEIEGESADNIQEKKIKRINLAKMKVDVLKTEENPQVKKNDEIDMNIVLPGTSRSGRLIKPKKFFEDTQKEEKKRSRKRTSKFLVESGEERSGGSRSKCSRTSTQCAQCELELVSHADLFRHLLLTHVPPEVVKTLPVYAEVETGWCQTCQQPLPLSLAEQHMAEKHPDLLSHSVLPSSLSQTPVSPARSPRTSDLTEESVMVGDLTEQSERLLEQVDKVLEDEEEELELKLVVEDEEEEELKFCADMGREMASLAVGLPASQSRLDQEDPARFVL